MSGSGFVHLHVHSEYSPLQGVCRLDALCDAAAAQGADALALTDTNGLYGALKFTQQARRAGLRPVLGAEVTGAGHRAVVLVKTAEGYANLCRLLSGRHCDPRFELIDAVRANRAGLILLSDDLAALAAWRQDSPHDLFAELSPGPTMHRTLEFATSHGIAPVATNRVHYITPEDHEVHRLLRAIATRTTLSRLSPDDCCAAGRWLAPPEDFAKHFPHVPEALYNTRRIADECWTDWDFSPTVFPAFRNWSDDDAFRVLRDKTLAGARRRYGTLSEAVLGRIEHELEIIRQKRYAHYFLVVEEIVRRSPLTCGRGSAAASIVAYCLGLTHVDPIRHRLYFERFLNPVRRDPPDIDLDFPWDERDALIQWVLERYGAQRAAMVSSHTTFGLRGAIRDIARVYGMPPDEIDRLAPHVARQADLLELSESSAARLWARSLCEALRLEAPWPEILNMAARIQGHFRHTAVHCGGLVIVPEEIRRHVPVEIAVKGVPVIQWEKEQTEQAGLVKIDLLGNRSLAVIRDALDAICQHTGRRLDYWLWDAVNDTATQNLIRNGDTLGCFYIESPATRLLLKKLWMRMPPERRATADVFDYLVIVSSLVRPAAISFVDQIVRRAHGAPYEPVHPSLADILADTHGILVYQEDVTRVAVALAGFSVDEADELRAVVSKKRMDRRLGEFCERFSRGALARGVSPGAIDAVWAMIMSFAGYSFCKPHSASYAQVSFKSAFLRAHYPAEFMAAVIANEGGYYSTFAYISEARRMGLTILPPDLNASDVRCTGAGDSIRIGLMQIRGLSRAVARRIVEVRRTHGQYRSFEDFLARLDLAPEQARLLVKAGAADTIARGLSRPALLWRSYAAASRSTAGGEPPAPKGYPEASRIRHEIEALGFPLTCHPLDLYRSALGKITSVPAASMGQWVGRRVTMLGWLVTVKVTQTKHGDPMEFVTFEDTTGLYEATFFPEVYRRYSGLLSANRPFMLDGVVQDDFGALTLTVRSVRLVSLRRVPAAGVWPGYRDLGAQGIYARRAVPLGMEGLRT